MATLLIDKGNSCVKWQLHEGKSLLATGVGTNGQSVDVVFSGLDNERVSAIFVASVAGEKFTRALAKWAEQHGWPKPNFIQSEARAFGVTNGYCLPQNLGVDRWLAIIAAHQQYTGLVCIVDCGTALTIDFVSQQGQHLGGFILPGIDLMISSLMKNTHNINAAAENTQVLLGNSTSQAVALAPAQALTAFIEKKVKEIQVEHNEPVQLVLTGGEASVLKGLLSVECHIIQDLVFNGLQHYAQQVS